MAMKSDNAHEDRSSDTSLSPDVVRLLRSALQYEPAPPAARELMITALDFASTAPIAELVLDTADVALSVRGRGPRQVLYETDSVAFDVTLNPAGVRGQVVGHEELGMSELKMVTTVDDHATSVDQLGAFGFDVSPAEPFYLQLGDGPRTGWILQ